MLKHSPQSLLFCQVESSSAGPVVTLIDVNISVIQLLIGILFVWGFIVLRFYRFIVVADCSSSILFLGTQDAS